MKLDDFPRVPLAHLPTPLEHAPRLGEKVGLENLWIKRDDQTGLATGGNKARKLEFLMADAVAKGADIILTDGGPQSNHARMTAAAARKLGLDVRLVLAGPDFEAMQGNLLLDVLFDAPITFLEGKDVPEMEAEMQVQAEALRREGRNPYVVPIGGSTAIGALGYVTAMRELAGQMQEQLGRQDAQIVLAVGSCGTFAGTLLGARMFLPQVDILGISVSRKKAPLKARSAEIANESSQLIEAGISIDPESINAYDEYVGQGYGLPTEAGRNAILTTARTEGLLLDPVYSGKAMSGLLNLAEKGVLDRQRPVVFLHTGGVAALFAFEPGFRELADLTKRY